jgi:ribokinase
MHSLLQYHSGQWGAVLTEVAVVGSLNIDLTSYLDHWPQIGETVHALKTRISLGGKGANQAVAAAKLGARVAMIGATGADSYGQEAAGWLQEYGVALHLKTTKAVATGMAFIDVGPNADNMIRLSAGANATLRASDITAQQHILSVAKVILLQNEIPLEASLEAARIGRANGATVVMDPAPAPMPFWSSETLEAFDILTPNAQETQSITGHAPKTLQAAEAAAQALRARGVRGSIITMGGAGVAWSIGDDSGIQPAPRVKVVDTVAAGDCFNGAFAAALACGHTVTHAIERAVIAASLATTREGAADSIPSLDELAAAMVRS